MAGNPILTSNYAYEPADSQFERVNPYLAAKGWAWVFQSQPHHLSEVKVLLTWEAAIALFWDGTKGQGNHWWNQPFQQRLRSHAGSLCWLTRELIQPRPWRGSKQSFLYALLNSLCWGNKQTKVVQARRERSWCGSVEGGRNLGATRGFGIES